MHDTLALTVPDGTDTHDTHADTSSAATRHMCAGVYVDRTFRDRIIRKIHNDPRHRVAPSYGFDLVPVVRHAWRSWLLDIGLLVVMLAILVAGLLMNGLPATLLVVCAVLFCRLSRSITRELPQVVKGSALAVARRFGFRGGKEGRRHEKADTEDGKRRLKSMLFVLFVVVAVPFALFYFTDQPTTSLLVPAFLIGACLVAVAIIGGVWRQLILVALTTTTRPHRLTRREVIIDEQQNHPCVIFRRPPHQESDIEPLDLWTRERLSPFVGSGKLVNRWLPPLTIQLLRPGKGSLVQREYTTAPISAHQLVEALRVELTKLGTDVDKGNLSGLQVRDRIYIAATDLPADGKLLRNGLGRREIRDLIDDHQLASHHFLETSVPIANGELVATVLIQVSLKGRSLTLDVATCALTRTPHAYHVPDWYGEHSLGGVLRRASRQVLAIPVDVLRIWRLAEVPVVLVGSWLARRDHTTFPRRRSVEPEVDVRHEIAGAWEHAHLDQSTIYGTWKIVERRIIKATEDFLREHEVDTTIFEKQAETIISTGVLNYGQMTGQIAGGINPQVNNNANAGAGDGSRA